MISFSLAVLLGFPVGNLSGQAPQSAPAAINIVVLEGEGLVHNARQRGGARRDPVVRIEDQDQKPMNEAAVVFTLPTEGATGEFGNGSKTLTIVTGQDGIAKAQGLKVYNVSGRLPIHVTASYRGLSARTIISQIIEGGDPNATGRKGGSGKTIAILSIIGAAAGGGYYAYQASTKSSAPPTAPITPSGPAPIGITPGGGTIAPPR